MPVNSNYSTNFTYVIRMRQPLSLHMCLHKKLKLFIQSMQKGFSFNILMSLYIHTTLIPSMITIEYDDNAGTEKQKLNCLDRRREHGLYLLCTSFSQKDLVSQRRGQEVQRTREFRKCLKQLPFVYFQNCLLNESVAKLLYLHDFHMAKDLFVDTK